jgi:protein-S-isoprenylcysteine O-methyltransferase Ste14
VRKRRPVSDLGYFTLGFGLLAVYIAAMAAVLFGAAGTFAEPMFWAYLALFAVLCVGASIAVYLKSPDLVKERIRPGEGEQDRVSVAALNLLLFLQLLLAGLDVGRLHWSATVPFALQILGLIGFAVGMGLTTWAMLVNRFFSSAVRLQPDRGHEVVTSGPYRLVRHPGYSGGLLLLLGAGFALGSWIAIAPILLIAPLMIRRTLIEERMLAGALPGYADYMERVRSRIVPGLW